MMLTTKGRYAVMAMVDIAAYGKENPVSLAEIAGRQHIALNYLEQLFCQLRKNGLVTSVRGPGGGYMLAGNRRDVTIADIVLAVEENIKITRCTEEKHSGCLQDKTPCLTHDLWAGLGRHIVEYLQSVSLEDVCNRQVKG